MEISEKASSLLGRLREETGAAIRECKRMKRPFVELAFIYFLGISAILRANFNYIDDMGRAYSGYKGWENFSRHMNMFLSGLIHADSFLTDISPLPQLIAVLLLVLSGIMVIYCVYGPETPSAWSVIAVVPLGLSPYFLECLSYKYDAPYMALSILASIVPVLLERYGSMVYIISVMLGELIVCTTYQASVGLFPMIVIWLGLLRWNRKEPLARIVSFFLDSVIGFFAALLTFQLFLRGGYSGYVDMSLPPLNRVFTVIAQNYQKYFSLVFSDWKDGWLALTAILCVLFLYTVVRASKQKRAAALVVSIVALAVMLLLSFGLYPAFEKPLFDPRAMYGFGVFIALTAVTAVAGNGRHRIKLSGIVSFILSWCFFVFAFTYGNALFVQKTYTDFRIQLVIDDLKSPDIVPLDGEKTIQIVGTIGHAPSLLAMPQDYQILNRLVPVTFCENWWWGQYGIQNYYGLRNLKWETTDFRPEEFPVLADSIYHTIRGDGEHLFIVLK